MAVYTLASDKDESYGYALYIDGVKTATWDEKRVLKDYVVSQVHQRMGPTDDFKEVSLATPFPKALEKPKPKAAPKVAKED